MLRVPAARSLCGLSPAMPVGRTAVARPWRATAWARQSPPRRCFFRRSGAQDPPAPHTAWRSLGGTIGGALVCTGVTVASLYVCGSLGFDGSSGSHIALTVGVGTAVMLDWKYPVRIVRGTLGTRSKLMTLAFLIPMYTFMMSTFAAWSRVCEVPVGDGSSTIISCMIMDRMELCMVSTAVPLMEEIAFRGILFKRVLLGVGARTAYALTGSTFGLAHYDAEDGPTSTSLKVAVAAITGCFFGAAYHVTGSVVAPFVLHMLNNLVYCLRCHVTSPARSGDMVVGLYWGYALHDSTDALARCIMHVLWRLGAGTMPIPSSSWPQYLANLHALSDELYDHLHHSSGQLSVEEFIDYNKISILSLPLHGEAVATICATADGLLGKYMSAAARARLCWELGEDHLCPDEKLVLSREDFEKLLHADLCANMYLHDALLELLKDNTASGSTTFSPQPGTAD